MPSLRALQESKNEYYDTLERMSDEDLKAEILHQMNRSLWKTAEARKCAIRRGLDKCWNSDIGGFTRARFIIEVDSEVCYTKGDLDILKRASQSHYDQKCRAASETGGVISTMALYLEDGTKVAKYTLTPRDLGLLCKITESLGVGDKEVLELHRRLLLLVDDSSRMWAALNPKIDEDQ